MERLTSGDLLPGIETPPPGPRSRALIEGLRRYESPNITYISTDFPIFWKEARGANVLDVDGNVYVDLTGGFAVAVAGHRNEAVLSAMQRQMDLLVHGLGDVHPPDVKVELLRRLAEITPAGLDRAILASSGAEAVEAALKTARLASGRPGVLRFSGGYHGLTYGALCVTDGDQFRAPFSDQLGIPTVRVPYPDPYRTPEKLRGAADLAGAAIELVRSRLDESADEIGAVIIEPIQGRAGVIVPPPGFLSRLREECDRRALVLIFDEIYTGFGRTGRWFACEHENVVPDLLCVGKALTGALPLSACVGRASIMEAWPPSGGEAIHTSTFLGHPLGCAAALAQIDEIERLDLVARAERLGVRLINHLRQAMRRHPEIGDVRGRGLMIGIELVNPASGEPHAGAAKRLLVEALRRGVLLLASRGTITLTPPLTISEPQLDFALQTIEACLRPS
jgi:4-aminobutyrate aminotransferase